MTVEEHSIYGGLGGLVAEILSEQSPRRVVRVGIEDRWGESAPNEFLLDLFHLSPARLSERVKSKLREGKLMGRRLRTGAQATKSRKLESKVEKNIFIRSD